MAERKDWPPNGWDNIYDAYHEYAAWYSGSVDRLINFYSSKAGPFWSKEVKNDRMTMLHVPVAGDIASVSSDLLFAEAPDIKIPQAHQEEAPQDAINTQDRLNEIINETDMYSRFLEAGETASALGGVFLKINWDTTYKPYPILSVAQPDNAIPEFKWGFLKRVTFHKVIDAPSMNDYWRLLEIHELGVIKNQLWRGSRFDLGEQLPLEARPETRGIKPVIETGINELACRYIPNKKPNREWRGSNLGQSDYSGIIGLMDSLDEAYTSWMRDLKLARGRIVVPEYMLDFEDGEPKFDIDKEVFSPLSLGPASTERQDKIENIQFDIRADEHKSTIENLLEKIYTMAGYSPQSFGMEINGSGTMTATEIKAKESKSYKTRNKKSKYMQGGLEEIIHIMLMIDANKFDSDINPDYRPQVDLREDVKASPMEKADSINKLNQAQAISIDTKVRLLHNDWNEKQIQAEVNRIKREQGIEVEEPEIRT